MKNTYWIVRYKGSGNAQPIAVSTTLRGQKAECIRAAMTGQRKGTTWRMLKSELDLECVKVTLADK